MASSKRNSSMAFVKKMPPMLSPLEHQQYQRLRVNRIAVMQELNVSHVIESLQQHSVIDKSDLTYIHGGESSHEQSRRLLEILPTKGKSSNWYKHFRTALLNPMSEDSAVRQRYQMLVEFLDNTIVDQMKHQIRQEKELRNPHLVSELHEDGNLIGFFSKYQPLPGINGDPQELGSGDPISPVVDRNIISQSEFFSNKMDDIYDEFDSEPLTVLFLRWETLPEGFLDAQNQAIKDSEIEGLQKSNHELDRQLAKQEQSVLYRFQQAEMACALWKNQSLPEDTIFCLCSPVLDVINHVDSYHLYYKHIQMSRKQSRPDIIEEMICSYDELSQWLVNDDGESTRQRLVKLGLTMVEFLTKVNEEVPAEQVLNSMLSYFTGINTLDTWVPQFKVYAKLMALSNKQWNFSTTNLLYSNAMTVKEQVDLVSFGQELIAFSDMYLQTSYMMIMCGEFGRAYTLSQRGLQEVQIEDKELVIDSLCMASLAYRKQFKLMRAEALAIEAMQQAKQHFNVYNTVYLNALLCYIELAIQCRKESFTLECADAALNIAQKLYRADSIQLAEALKCKAAALVATGKLDDGLYFTLAQKAHNMAMSLLPINHPALIPYISVLIECLLAKTLDINDSGVKTELLTWAHGETSRMMKLSQRHFGDISIQTAETMILMGDLNFKTGRFSEADESYTGALQRAIKFLGPSHGFVQCIKTKVAAVRYEDQAYKTTMDILKDVVNNFDTGTYYLEWYNQACEMLIQIFHKLDQQEELKEYKSIHLAWKWTSEDQKRQIHWRLLHAPPEPFETFLQKFDVWSMKVKKVQDQLDKMKLQSNNEKSAEPKP